MVGPELDIDISGLDWDDENVDHIARHEVEPADVEFVLANAPLFFRNLPGRSATHVVVGWDSKDRALFVPVLQVGPDKWRVITAFESRNARKLLGGRANTA